jgi:Fe2+ or Zn2+ uptake regulation protein
MRTLEQQVQVLRAAGYRVTQSRVAVLTVLAETDGVLDAATICAAGRELHPKLGRVSVYRALELLAELGLARRVHGANGCRSYARANWQEGHYLVCQGCGQVQEFPCDGLDRLVEQLGREYRFAVRHHLLQLEGLCAGCLDADGGSAS